MKHLDPTLTPAAIYSAIEDTADDMGLPGFDFDSGHGFCQADLALGSVMNNTGDCIPDANTLCLLDGQYAVTAQYVGGGGVWNQARAMTVLDNQGAPSQKTGGMAFGDPETMSIGVAVRPACSGGFSADWAAVGSMDLAQWELEIRRVADGALWTRQQVLGGNTSGIDQQAFPCL